MNSSEPTIQSLSQSLKQNSQLVDQLSQQLDQALQEIHHLKELIIQKNSQPPTPEPAADEIDICRLRQEIQDSFRNLKHDYEKELLGESMKGEKKHKKFEAVMPPIRESPENDSRVLNEITPPQNHEFKVKGPRQKTSVTFGDQLRYEGQMVNGLFDGFGIVTREDQQLFVGSFRSGLFHGQGRLLHTKWLQPRNHLPFEQWVSYSGEFQEGSFDGMGTLVLSTHQKYLGRFRRGKIEGEGVYYKDGGIELGRWERNRFCSFL